MCLADRKESTGNCQETGDSHKKNDRKNLTWWGHNTMDNMEPLKQSHFWISWEEGKHYNVSLA